MRRLFTHEGADVMKTDSSSKFVLDSLKLSIFDAHLDYMKDFGANLESSLRRQDEKAVVFVEELDEDLELVKESSDIISSLPMVPVSKGIYTRINVRSVEHFQQLMKREELLRKNIQDQDKANQSPHTYSPRCILPCCRPLIHGRVDILFLLHQ